VASLSVLSDINAHHWCSECSNPLLCSLLTFVFIIMISPVRLGCRGSTRAKGVVQGIISGRDGCVVHCLRSVLCKPPVVVRITLPTLIERAGGCFISSPRCVPCSLAMSTSPPTGRWTVIVDTRSVSPVLRRVLREVWHRVGRSGGSRCPLHGVAAAASTALVSA
jgi:hypothetical protein